MSDDARRAHGTSGSERSDPFSLQAHLDRQREEFASTGPTMAEILADLDRFRAGGLAREAIVASIREDRDGRS